MNNGFIKVAAATPKIKVGDCKHNAVEICSLIREAYRNKTQLIVFPELCITGYTAGDLFWQKALLDNAMKALIETIVPYTEGKEPGPSPRWLFSPWRGCAAIRCRPAWPASLFPHRHY